MVLEPTPLHLEFKPRLRGVIHQYSAWVSTVAATGLIVGAALLKGAGAAAACAIYGITVFGLFTISATYHRHKWGSERTARLMKRAACWMPSKKRACFTAISKIKNGV